MKLSRIKTCMFGFIVVLISLFSFNFSAKADNYIALDYDSYDSLLGTYYDTTMSHLEDLRTFLKDYEDTHYYAIFFNKHALVDVVWIQVYMAEKQDNINSTLYLNETGSSWRLNSNNTYAKTFYFSSTMNSSSDNFLTNFETFKSKVENNNFKREIWGNQIGNDNFSNGNFGNGSHLLYYSNLDFKISDDSVYDLKIGNDILEVGDIITSYKNYNFGMMIESNYANDLQGRDIYSIKITILNSYDENYSYQYSYDDEKYYDMEGLSSTNLAYFLTHAINIPIYFRILDENDVIIWSKYYYENFELVNKNIPINEFTSINDDGKKIIGVEFDLSQYLQFDDVYDFKFYINGLQQDIRSSFNLNIYEDEWDDTIYHVELKIDNLSIESFEYKPKIGNQSFDDKYDQVLEDNLEDELGDSDYSTVGGMVDSLNSFINAIKEFVTTFFSLIMGFFNKLNIWIRSFVIGIFIVMVICKIVKVVRK